MEEKLPEGWVWTTLEGVAEIRDDMRVPVNAEERLHRLGPYPYYGATGQVGWIDDYLMDGEYVLLGEDGAPFLDPIKPKAYLISGKSWVNNHAHVLHVLEGMGSNRYLLYGLNILDYRGVVNGTTRLKLTQAAMRQILIPLAPFNEQNCIVSAIEQQFTRLDSAIASLKSAKARIKQYRASLLKSAVEGELTREWRAEHPVSETGEQLLARILQDRRAGWEEEQLRKMGEKGLVPKDEKWKERYEEPLGPDVENLPELPEGWCWATVEQIADVGTGATPLRSRGEYYDTGIIPWITSGSVNSEFITSAEEFITEKALKETNVKVFPIGSLILAMYGEGKTRGKISELKIDAATNQACAAIVFRPFSFICQPYVKYFFMSNYLAIRSFAVGGVQPNLNLTIVKETVIPFPPLIEQKQIIAEVEARLSTIEQTELATENSLKRAERNRQSILQEAFAGRLVPQDPNDEPASILLERIREERKKREEAGKAHKEERKMIAGQQRKKRNKNIAPLYDVLVEAGGELSPEDLYQRSENQRKSMPEEDRGEVFYIELDAEVTAGLIREDRPTLDKVSLQALELDSDEQEESAFPLAEMRHAREWSEPDLDVLLKPEMREAREEQAEPQPRLDKQPKGKLRHQTKEDANTLSLWDE